MRWLGLFLLLATPLAGQEDPAQDAQAALAQLEAAAESLASAAKARDRVRALTETVQAYEAGLGAIRQSLRRVTIREDQLRRKLASRDRETSKLIGLLLTIQPGQSASSFLHPAGPEGTAHAGMLLADLAPELGRQAALLRRDIADVSALALLQRDAAERLQDGLRAVQEARIALNSAMAERTDLPYRFLANPERAAGLLASAETLDAFSSGLVDIAEDDLGWNPPDLEDRIGDLSLPVRGVILRRPGEPDAAGIERPGLLVATRPGALVTAPTDATIRYAGPLLDMGNVIILEPRSDVFFVLAGLQTLYGDTGQVIAEGTPIGLMGGLKPDLTQIPSSTGGEGAGTERRETLYIEVRHDNVPQDPDVWFRTDKDE